MHVVMILYPIMIYWNEVSDNTIFINYMSHFSICVHIHCKCAPIIYHNGMSLLVCLNNFFSMGNTESV